MKDIRLTSWHVMLYSQYLKLPKTICGYRAGWILIFLFSLVFPSMFFSIALLITLDKIFKWDFFEPDPIIHDTEYYGAIYGSGIMLSIMGGIIMGFVLYSSGFSATDSFIIADLTGCMSLVILITVFIFIVHIIDVICKRIKIKPCKKINWIK
jgi:hypothetical protein